MEIKLIFKLKMIFLLNHQSNQQVKFEGIKKIISWITGLKFIFSTDDRISHRIYAHSTSVPCLKILTLYSMHVHMQSIQSASM